MGKTGDLQRKSTGLNLVVTEQYDLTVVLPIESLFWNVTSEDK